jgi:hypothetical protein
VDFLVAVSTTSIPLRYLPNDLPIFPSKYVKQAMERIHEKFRVLNRNEKISKSEDTSGKMHRLNGKQT